MDEIRISPKYYIKVPFLTVSPLQRPTEEYLFVCVFVFYKLPYPLAMCN